MSSSREYFKKVMCRQYRRIGLIICSLFSLFSFFSLSQAEEKCYPCYHISSPVTLDGKLQEVAWQSLPEATGFYNLYTKDYVPYKQTFFKMGWDEKNIYLGIRCEEPDVKEIKATRKDGEVEICMEDSIEVFLFPKKVNIYFQFMVNTIGSRWNGIGVPGNPEIPLGNWQAKTYQGKDYYSVEIKIPFEILGRFPENNEKWTGNLCRNIYIVNSGGNRHTTWALLKKTGFHDYQNFAALQFKKRSLSAEEARCLQRDLSIDFIRFARKYLNDSLRSIQEEVSTLVRTFPTIKEKVAAFRKTALELEKILTNKEASSSELCEVLSKSRLLEEEMAILNLMPADDPVGFRLTSASSMQRVLRDRRLKGPMCKPLRLAAGANGWASGQLVIIAGKKKLRDVRIQVLTLKSGIGDDSGQPTPRRIIGGDKFMLSRVHYVEIKVPSPGRDSRPGWYPDPLEPLNAKSRFDIEARTVQPIWVAIKVPPETRRGDYMGSINVQANVEGKGRTSVGIDLALRVFDVKLPKRRILHIWTTFTIPYWRRFYNWMTP
ncbi:MAG: hypothetical protein KAX20_05555, partial [Candidatus Omnitrophica bacterium]|nr:hypothetical protein [Candidatus Omnitrophota bacterium]